MTAKNERRRSNNAPQTESSTSPPKASKTPSKAAIKAWLLKEGSSSDLNIEDNLGPGESVTQAQKRELYNAWADGWSSYSADWLKNPENDPDYEKRFESHSHVVARLNKQQRKR